MSMTSGKLISFEGIDGAGKTTQVALLREYFEKNKQKVILTREPGGTYVAEQIRAILLDPKNKSLDDLSELLLYEAARAQVYQEIVIPALQKGTMVIMDRSLDSAVVYQGMARGLGRELVEQLNKIATRGRMPDVTFLLDIPLTVSQKRKEAGALDRLEQEAERFHHKVRRGYLQLYEEDGGQRIKKINATKSVDEVFQQILSIWQMLEG